ncbi:acyl transferase domain-containing protein [Saccharothrix tamanrassetensis]|uniref:Acyl transferase domain-containing protein n=1 Tax=Saccharothrix tamanrassetensis TaxID=1051531 RepID=A0A841CQ12_9PSEU|nr:polyketide synthase [Saccharothrix tamanrassetensis]MBB5959791.1 acyl transferase domain-containing protein [Saccharothrix tamanrassetensis]
MAAGKDGEPIAVVGIGCRFPRVRGPREFWRALCDGVDAVDDIGDERPGLAALLVPDAQSRHRPAHRMGLLEDVSAFDAEFFGISRRQAAHMDPQQRLMVETTWEAFEDAGIVPGTPAVTGVCTAQLAGHYWPSLVRDGVLDMYGSLGGGMRGALSGQLSFLFDLRGPSFEVGSGCSAGLVAVHLACRSLRDGECDTALAGAVHLILGPDENIAYARSGVLSRSGRSAFADASADGFARGEGCAVVVLKRLSTALSDGDRVYATIRGTAVNNDGGAAASMLAPAGVTQEQVLRNAYRDAATAPAEVSFVEAHGVGTPVGDPVEIGALAAVLGAGRPPDRPLLLTSLKGNFGHQEPVSGLAGLAKACLSLHHRVLPPTLHHSTPTPAIEWDGLPCSVAVAATRLSGNGETLVAGVNSFSVTGTNAHAVIASAPRRAHRDQRRPGPHLLPLSARHRDSLTQLLLAYADFVDEARDVPLADICHTAAVRRAHHKHRRAVWAYDHAGMAVALRRASEDLRAPTPPRDVVFVLHHGQSDPHLVAELSRRSRPFREAYETGAARGAGSGVGRSPLSDGLVALWRSWGVEPASVVDDDSGPVPGTTGELVLRLGPFGASVGEVPGPGSSPLESLVDNAGSLYESGCELSWDVVSGAGELVDVPLYPWRRTRYWAPTTGGPAERPHPLLPDHGTEHRSVEWCAPLPADAGRTPLTPGGLVELSIAVAQRLCGGSSPQVRDLRVVHNPRLVAPTELRAMGTTDAPGRWRFSIGIAATGSNGGTPAVASSAVGVAHVLRARPSNLASEREDLWKRCPEHVRPDEFEAWLRHSGVPQGPGVLSLSRGPVDALVDMTTAHPNAHLLRFAVLDVLLATGAMLRGLPGEETTEVFLEHVTMAERLPHRVQGLVSSADDHVDIRVCDDNGTLVTHLAGVRWVNASVDQRSTEA